MKITKTENGYLVKDVPTRKDEEYIWGAVRRLANAFEEKERGNVSKYLSGLRGASSALNMAKAHACAEAAADWDDASRPKTKKLFEESAGMGYLQTLVKKDMEKCELVASSAARELHAENLYKQIAEIKNKFQIDAPLKEDGALLSVVWSLRFAIYDLLLATDDRDNADFLTLTVLFELLPNSKVFLRKAGEEVERD